MAAPREAQDGAVDGGGLSAEWRYGRKLIVLTVRRDYTPSVSGFSSNQSVAVFSNSQEGRLCRFGVHWLSVRKAQRSSLNVMANNWSRASYRYDEQRRNASLRSKSSSKNLTGLCLRSRPSLDYELISRKPSCSVVSNRWDADVIPQYESGNLTMTRQWRLVSRNGS